MPATVNPNHGFVCDPALVLKNKLGKYSRKNVPYYEKLLLAFLWNQIRWKMVPGEWCRANGAVPGGEWCRA